MLDLHITTSDKISKITTENYSTSFTLGIKAFHKPVRKHIYAIYAFSRYADEIVDTFLERSIDERRRILHNYRDSVSMAISDRVSPFPVLQAFQRTVNEYDIPEDLIHAFFSSMEMDLENAEHNTTTYDDYIYGSAEVIGLMCLKVFVKGDQQEYERLKESARKLGSAFQKVNFLRDMKSDYEDRGRIYFPEVNLSSFDANAKSTIEDDIEQDFRDAYEGMLQLPIEVRKGVYLAYKYYYSLFTKIKRAKPEFILEERVRIPNIMKLAILTKTLLRGAVGSY